MNLQGGLLKRGVKCLCRERDLKCRPRIMNFLVFTDGSLSSCCLLVCSSKQWDQSNSPSRLPCPLLHSPKDW